MINIPHRFLRRLKLELHNSTSNQKFPTEIDGSGPKALKRWSTIWICSICRDRMTGNFPAQFVQGKYAEVENGTENLNIPPTNAHRSPQLWDHFAKRDSRLRLIASHVSLASPNNILVPGM